MTPGERKRFAAEIAEVQKLMDNTADFDTDLEALLNEVYNKGVAEGRFDRPGGWSNVRPAEPVQPAAEVRQRKASA